METALVVARWVHFECALALFGLSVFVAYAAKTARTVPAFRRRASRVLYGLALLTPASALAWWACAAATMSGDPSQAFAPKTLALVLTATSFGHLWSIRLLLTAAALVALAREDRSARPAASAALVLCTGALAVTLSGAGHAWAALGLTGTLLRVSDPLHLAAAGLWMGSLLGLALLFATPAARAATDLPAISRRVSAIGLGSVAVLAATGIVDAVVLVGSPNGLLSTPYGRLLGVKILFFLLAIALAAVNRFFALGRLRADARQDGALRRGLLVEQGAIALILLAVAAFGILPPPASGG